MLHHLSHLFPRIILTVLLGFVMMFQAHAQTPEYDEALSAYQNQNFLKAQTIWVELAELGNVNAQYALGVMHLRGEASDPSNTAAFSWFEKAAAEGHPTAMFNLGVAYWEGAGVEENRRRALALWEQSAQKGDSGAQFNLGLAYYIGEERETDFEQASKWIGLAADQQHPEAKRILKMIEEEANASQRNTTGTAAVATTADGGAQASAAPQQTGASTTTAVVETGVVSGASSSPQNRYWKTINRTIPLYDKPGGTAFREMPAGTPLEVIGQDGGWAKITVPDGLKTWVYQRFVTISGNQGIINTDAVRVRPSPSTDNAISPPLGKYQEDARILVLDHIGDWVQIRAPKTVGAWLRVDDIVQYSETEAVRQKEWERARANGV